MTAQITVDETGITVPTADDVKTAFQTVLTNAFGSDLSLDDSTPQGVLINDLTEEKLLDNALLLYFYNQLNPETATGVFQDALGSIYGMQRKVATSTIVNCVCTGLQGTVLNGKTSLNPAMAQSVNGDLFQCINGGTIPASGSITLQFESVETGEIPAPANSVNRIFSSVSGWDSINNTTAGVLGTEQESRVDFEKRRKQELARNATGSLSSVYSRVFEVEGVTDVFVAENDKNTADSTTYSGITIQPHSIYVCVNGGTSADLAQAIYDSKSAGCDTTGNNTCSKVIDGKTYTYNYDIPTYNTFFVKVGVGEAVSPDVSSQIKEVILNDYDGKTDDESITIGSSIYASRFYGDISRLQINGLKLINVKVSKGGSDSTTYSSSGITGVSVNDATFQLAVSDTAGSYVFSYDGADWSLNGDTVDLADYGISFDGTASSGDTITVVWTASVWSDVLTYNVNELPVITENEIIFEVI